MRKQIKTYVLVIVLLSIMGIWSSLYALIPFDVKIEGTVYRSVGGGPYYPEEDVVIYLSLRNGNTDAIEWTFVVDVTDSNGRFEIDESGYINTQLRSIYLSIDYEGNTVRLPSFDFVGQINLLIQD